MRWAYKIGLGLLVLALALVVGAEQSRRYLRAHVASVVVARFKARTGLELLPARTSIRFSTHLVIELEEPLVLDRTQQIVKLKQVDLLCSYHSLLFEGGLPLYAIVLNYPQLRLFKGQTQLSVAAMPPLNAEAARVLELNVERFSTVTRRLRVLGASVVDADGNLLFDNVSVEAYRKRGIGSTWRAKVFGTWQGALLHGLKVAGDLHLGHDAKSALDQIAHGRVWLWDVPIEQIKVAGLTAHGYLTSDLLMTLGRDGSASVDSKIVVHKCSLSGARLKAPTPPGDIEISATAGFSSERLNLNRLTLKQGGKQIVAAQGRLDEPYSANPAVKIRLQEFSLDANQIKLLLFDITDIPQWLTDAASRLKTGRLHLVDLSLDTSLSEFSSPSFDTFRKVNSLAMIQSVGYRIPEGLKLPDLDALEARVSLANGIVTVKHGEAQMGNSEFTSLDGELDLSSGLDKASYHLAMDGNMSVSQLYPFVIGALGAKGPSVASRIQKIEGMAAVSISARGRLQWHDQAPPDDYKVELDARHVDLGLKDLPSDFALVGGRITWRPSEIRISDLAAEAERGSATLSGKLTLNNGNPKVDTVAVELHQLPAEVWLPMLVDTTSLAAKGPVGGSVTLSGDTSAPGATRAEGSLVLSHGSIQFGFLRSPVEVQAASLALDGHGATLDMSGAQLEGDPLSMKVGVADLSKPEITIDAKAANLDLEVMKFVRMPWRPKTESSFFGNTPARGRIEARRAQLEKLPITDFKTDFTRDGGNWHLYNLSAEIFKGSLEMEVIARDEDDWVHIIGHSSGVELGPLLLLSGKSRTAAVVGSLFADADLWADTDGDFFETMAGKCSLVVNDGTLNRFTLLSRLLDLINLGQWLTAKFPDPRKITGVPFNTLSGTFSGHDGLFYTDDFLLDGPLMKFSAAGGMNLGKSTLDMQVGIRPVLTVGAVVNRIPVVGPRLRNGSSGIIQAYFDVHGSVDNPRVTPAPITSIAEAVKRTLFLPVNILRPNTVK